MNSAAPHPPVWVVSFPERQPYAPLWELQKRLWAQRWAGRIPDTLLLLEHDPVVTLGKNARRENLLLPTALFRERGVEVVEVDRGGDVTYHGPGQLVGYWIFDLHGLRPDVHWYLRSIEEVLIRTLRRFGLEGGRDPKATGVWVDGRKVAAMGMHLSHWVSTHGFALNLNTDLAPFSWIVPCGLTGREVTSMRALRARAAGGTGAAVPEAAVPEVVRREVELVLVEEAAALFERTVTELTPLELSDILMQLERRAGPEPGGEEDGAWSSRRASCPA